MANRTSVSSHPSIGVDRRTLLVGVGALSAVGLLTGPARSETATRLELSIPRLRLHLHGADPGELPPLDARPMPMGDIEGTDGSMIGSLTSTALAGSTHPGLHHFALAEGSIVGVDAGTLEGPHSIVSGTGRYADAEGTYTIRRRPDGHLVIFTLRKGAR